MTAASLPFGVDSGPSRFITFGSILILAASLTLAKVTLLTMDLLGKDLTAWSSGEGAPEIALGPVDPISPNDEDFVAWPSVLPEPAAGPSEETMDPGPATPFGDPILAFDPSTLTEGQLLALQQLAARRQQLDEREQLLDIRAELSGRAEARLDEQIDRLADLKIRIETLMADLDDAEEQKLARLVKIYETMKPKAAAEIFNRLDIPILLHVVERMKEAKSAVVLGKMDPAIAKRVTTELARRKERPRLGAQNLGG